MARNNKDRQQFIPREWISRVLNVAPDTEWRLIIVLARYGGLRTPSETLSLRWRDIYWDRKQMLVTAPKTEHHEGGASRLIPIFPEVRMCLDEAWEQAEEGAEFVISKHRPKSIRNTAGNWEGANLRTTFSRLTKRAGLTLWPRVFQNLRSTRATELADEFPGHVVSAWLGHSEDIAKEHYRQVTEEHFLRASSQALPDLMPHDAVLPRIDSQAQNQVHAQLVSAQEETAACGSTQPSEMEDRGLGTGIPNIRYRKDLRRLRIHRIGKRSENRSDFVSRPATDRTGRAVGFAAG
jgi:hypothetical protein